MRRFLYLVTKKCRIYAACGVSQTPNMEETERRVIQEWIEYLEDDASLEAQQAYCQGYVDCIFLLSGMGMIEKDNTVNEFLDYMKK